LKSADEIFELAKSNTQVSDKLERILWLNCRNIIHMYQTNQIDKDKASQMKNKAYIEYAEEVLTYEAKKLVYEEHIQNIKKTELLRAEFNKNPTLDKAIELIGIYSGQVKHYENIRRELSESI